MPTPQKLVVNCAAWGARQLFDEARALDAKRAEAMDAGDETAAAGFARNADGCRTAGRNALLAAGLPDDENIEPETWVPLTDEEIAQREKDREEGERFAWKMLRSQRDALLAASDWTQLPGARLDAETKARWDAYRDQLFDLPANTANPRDPQWPVVPA